MLNKFNFYTVAQGADFFEAALKSAESFVKHNQGIKYTIFLIGPLPNGLAIKVSDGIKIELIDKDDCSFFSDRVLAKKPYADISLFKCAVAPKYLDDRDYICFLDVDTICNKPLDIKYFKDQLDNGCLCVAADSKAAQRKSEIDAPFSLYFNSGVMFYNSSTSDLITDKFLNWILDNEKLILDTPWNDQTWLNIYFNTQAPQLLYGIGNYFNNRGRVNDKEAYIWHYGRKYMQEILNEN